jgi:hypothetical protein
LEGRIVSKNLAVLLPQQVVVADSLKGAAPRGTPKNKAEVSERGEQAVQVDANGGEAIELPALSATTPLYQFEPIQLAQAGSVAGVAGGSAGAAAEAGGLIGGMSATTVAAVAAVGVVGIAAASSGGGSGGAGAGAGAGGRG